MALPASAALARLRGRARIPVVAILVTTVVGGALFLLSIVAGDIYSLMVNFTAGGFYLAFLFPLIGFVVVLVRRGWTDGAFSLGRATVPGRRGGRGVGDPPDPQHRLAAGRLSSSATWTGRCGSGSRCWVSGSVWGPARRAQADRRAPR